MAEAATAAAQLVNALHNPAAQLPGVRELLRPAVHASLVLEVGPGVLCSSGNLLQSGSEASSLYQSTSSLAGLCLTARNAKIVLCPAAGGPSPTRWGPCLRSPLSSSLPYVHNSFSSTCGQSADQCHAKEAGLFTGTCPLCTVLQTASSGRRECNC